MQTKTIATMAASAMLATGVTAAPAASSTPAGVFHVRGFNTLCTETVPQSCVSNFNLSLNAQPPVHCHLNDSATDYQLCGVEGPEQAYYAYIKKSSQGISSLFAEFVVALPGNTDTKYGNTTLNHGPNFDFIESGETDTSSSP